MSEHGTGPSRGFEPLAIIGMGCLFPKADSLEAYWSNIRDAVDCVGPVPDSHWLPNDYFDADPKRPDFTYAQRGAFLEAVDFDPLAYGILPNALEATDTSQLLGMVAAGMALRDAGYGPERAYDRGRVSAIIGVTGALELVVPLGARLGHPKWRRALRDAGLDEAKTEEIVQRIADEYVPWQEASFPGLLGNVVAGRISKQFDLGGTNCVVDAACASSLSAVHLAALELQSGKADMVVTGGVDTFNDIFMYMCFSKTPALSPTGDSRPFAADADGTILGEGLGMVVLKRLADAERDGDPIDAVITGIGSSSDGKGDAIYAPNADGQRRAMQDAYQVAGITPDTIELIEAHGTGTKVGDATEVKSLSSVFDGARAQAPWCAVGSVKSQIGHTKAAAGAAGLIKAALALKHKVLPPTAKVSQPAQAMRGNDSPFYVNTEKRPWVPGKGHPRRAGVSAFGFGGSNFHAVLEEHGELKSSPTWDGAVQLAAFSADSPAGLTTQLDAFAESAGNWERVRALAKGSRSIFDSTAEHRLCLVLEKGGKPVADAIESAREQLAKGGDSWTLPDGASYASGDKAGGLALLFPGQGSQYTGMLRDLACDFPEMLHTLAQANEAFDATRDDLRLSDAIYPLPAFDDDTRARNEERLRATDVAQPALGAVSLGALGVLRRFGVTAEAYAGHSYGELPALAAAGVLNEADCLRLSIERGTLMAGSGEDRGTMLAVRAPLAEIEELINSHELDVVLANRNAPDQAVLSGSREAIAAAAEVLTSRKIAAKELPVAAAFHSPLVADASQPFQEALKSAEWSAPSAPVYANTTGLPYPNDENKSRGLLAGQLAQPVHFSDTIEHLYENGARTFVEVGPKAVLTGLVTRILSDQPHTAVALDASQGKRSGVSDLARVLAQVAVAGHEVQLTKWDEAFVAPSEGGRKRMTIPVGGANIHEPKRKVPSFAKASEGTPSITKALDEAPRKPERIHPAPAAPAPMTASTPERTAPAMREETPRPEPQSGPVSNDALMILQRMQEQTAQLHKQFLDGQQTALETLKALVQGGHGQNAANAVRVEHPPQSPFKGGLSESASPGGRASSRAEATATAPPHPNPLPEGEGAFSPPFEKGGPGGISPLECLAVTVQAIEDGAAKAVPLTRERTIWLTGDDSGLADALAWQLQKRGYKAEAVDWSARDGIKTEETGGLVVVAPIAGDGAAFTRDAFALMQRLSPALQHLAKNGGALMATVTRLDGAFGLLDGCDGDAAAFAGLGGLTKTAGHEWDGIHCRALDAAAEVIAGGGDAVTRIVDALLSEGPAEIGLRPEGRVTPSLQPIETAPGASAFNRDDVIVISGGGRGVTAAVAIEIARRSQASLVLLGRSPAPADEPAWLSALTDEAAIKKGIVAQGEAKTPKEIEQRFRSIEANRELRQTLAAVESAGSKVMYASVDIREREAVAAAMGEARAALGPITGIVHGAGVLADKRIEDKDAADFERVFGTKVDGLDALLAGTGPDSLKTIALFSSSTGRFGRTGQIDYAAANEVLNKRAQAEAAHRTDCRVVAFNWGPWDGGMVTPGLKALFEKEGVGTIGLSEGAAYFCDEMARAQGPVEIVVLGAGTGSEAAPREASHAEAPNSPRIELVAAGDPSLEALFGFDAGFDALPILRDHVMDNKGVVPAALQMEWLAHTALHAHPGMHLAGLDGFQILKGVVLDADETRAVSLWTGAAIGDNGSLRVPVELRGALPDGSQRLHARATAIVSGSHEAPLPYEALTGLDGYPCPREAYYQDARLFHGPGLQCVVEVEGCSDNAIVGVVQRAPVPKQWMSHPLRSAWIMDPMALDGAFQLMILWARQCYGAPSLPTAVGRYRQFRKAFPKSDIRVTARVTKHSPHRAEATIDFTNWGGGDLVARIEGYECVIDPSLEDAFARNTLGGAAAETAR